MCGQAVASWRTQCDLGAGYCARGGTGPNPRSRDRHDRPQGEAATAAVISASPWPKFSRQEKLDKNACALAGDTEMPESRPADCFPRSDRGEQLYESSPD